MKKQSAGRRVRREKIRRKKMQVREKVGKSRNTVFFRGFVAPEGWKVGSLKRRVRRHLGRWEMKSCTPLWREADFEVKRYKTPQDRTTFGSWEEVKCVKNWGVRSSFGSWDDEKVHGVVARSTISKWKGTKHRGLGALLEVQMSKKCTPLWREAHFEVKMLKTPGVRTTFGGSDVEKVHAIVARSTFRSQNVKKHQGFGPLLEVQMSLRFASLHYTTLHYTPLHYTPLHYITQHYNYNYNYTTTLHYTPYTPLH